MGFRGAWKASKGLQYDKPTPPQGPVSALHATGEPTPDKWEEGMSAPARQGFIEDGLIEVEDSWSSTGQTSNVVDRTPEDHAHGATGADQDPALARQISRYAHSEDLGSVAHVNQSAPQFFQTDRKVMWRQETAKPLGHGSQAAVGRGLNGLDMNNDPTVQQYGLRRYLAVERKFPGKRVWGRQLQGFRPKLAYAEPVSQPVGDTTNTSWAPTQTLARSGKTHVPMLRQTPRNWAEAATTSDQGQSAADAEPVWGL